jgi:tetratricopeptide (TPR) repeat protein
MISFKRASFVILSAVIVLGFAGFAAAQQPSPYRPIYPSQKASVMQTIGVTDVTITYFRPGVKGRPIFGDAPASMEERAKGEATLDNQNERKPGEPIVPYNHVWRAGANEATVFQVTDDVLINGQPLKAGTYSLQAIPGKDEWTIIFNGDPGQWGAFTYDPKKDVLRVKAKPQTVASNQEWLLFTFDPVSANSATANLRWANVNVPFTVEVKDVKALWRAKADALIASNPANEVFPMNVANTLAADKNWDEALKYVDQSIRTKTTFRNLAARATILRNAGRTQEALAAADQAIAKGKTEGVDTSAFEKRVAGWKSAP